MSLLVRKTTDDKTELLDHGLPNKIFKIRKSIELAIKAEEST